jgi:DNA-directed RNA polymerase specialized sigma24 family protein
MMTAEEAAAFVLHDVLSLSYEEVSATVGRSHADCGDEIQQGSRPRGQSDELAAGRARL